MKFSLRVKLTAAFLIVTLFLFVVIGFTANVLLETQFMKYVIEKQERRNRDIVTLLSSRFSDWGGHWDAAGIESIGVNILSEGLMLRVKDKNGNVLWDANVHNEGFCKQILERMAQNMQSHLSNFEGGYTEKSFPLKSGDKYIGTVDIGYYGPYYYNDNDIRYLDALNNLLIWATLISALFSMFLGIIMAKHLTKPIHNVITTAKKIAQGDFGGRVQGKSDTKEIIELTETINSLAETLGKQEALSKQITADVAHELRTPLMTLQSHLEAMIDGIWKPELSRLLSCHEETVRISKMVGDLEKLTLYERENLVLVKKRFDIAALIRRNVLNFESQYQSKNIKLDYYVQPLEVYADEDKIGQVLVNLLSNALKFTNEGGKVEIKVSTKGKFVDIQISDTGIGIGKDDLPYIFDRLYRVEKSRNRLTGGSGIGLAIVKAIVEAHNGKIVVQSVLGKGSTFIVSLPAEKN